MNYWTKCRKRLDSAQGQRERQTKNQYFSDRRWERHISADDRSTAGYGEYCFGVLNEEEQEQLEMLLSKLISELEKNQGEEFSG